MKKINIYEYPENLGNRLGNKLDRKGNLKLGKPLLEYALLEKVNEIIDYINDQKK